MWISRIAINLKLILDRHDQFLPLMLWTYQRSRSVGLYSWRGAAGGGKEGKDTGDYKLGKPSISNERLGMGTIIDGLLHARLQVLCFLSHLTLIISLWGRVLLSLFCEWRNQCSELSLYYLWVPCGPTGCLLLFCFLITNPSGQK